MEHFFDLLAQIPGKLWQNFSEIIIYLAIGGSALLAGRAKDWMKNRTQDLKSTIGLDKRLYQMMAETRAVVHSDRVKLFQFMNGHYYVGGISKQRMILTHIVTRTGVSYPIGLVNGKDGIITSQLNDFLSSIYESHTVVFARVPDLKDPYLQQLLIANGTEAVLAGGLFDSKGKLIGVLMVTWLDSDDMPKADALIEFKLCCTQIGAAIDIK